MKKRLSGPQEDLELKPTEIKTFTPEQIAAATLTRTNPLLTLSKKVASTNSGEKYLTKKIRTLYDVKANVKSRFSALEEILDTIQDVDIPLFYRENIEVIFEVLSFVFMKQVSKIKQKTLPTLLSKEVSSLLKTLPILKQIFIFLSNKVQQGWEEDTLVVFFTQLLHYGNHPNLRKEGFALLLTWLSILKQPTEGSVWLYRNAIPLDVYSFDRVSVAPRVIETTQSGYLYMDQELIHLDDRTPLVPNTYPPSYADSNELIQILLTNLAQLSYIVSGSGLPSDLELTQDEAQSTLFPPEDYLLGLSMDSANASLKFMFDLFQKHYLAKLFVEQGRELLPTVSLKEFVGFEYCPPSLLHVLTKFLVRNCLEDESKLLGLGTGQVLRTQPSPVCPILKKIFFGTSKSRSFVNEILKQSLSLVSYGFSTVCMESTRSAILIIGTWFRSSVQERPVFMRNRFDQTSIFDDYVQMYLEMVHSALTWEVCYSITDQTQPPYNNPQHFSSTQDSNPASLSSKPSLTEFTELQSHCYSEVFLLYQTVITDTQNSFSELCKDFVCQSLLEINERLIYLISTSPPLLPSWDAGKLDLKSNSLVNALNSLYETVFYAWTVSKVDNQDLWLLFQKSLTKSTALTPLLQHWTLTLRRFTCLLAKQLYFVETDPNSAELEDLIGIGNRRNRKPAPKPKLALDMANLTLETSPPEQPLPAESNSQPSSKRGYSFGRKTSVKLTSPFATSENRNHSSQTLSTPAYQGYQGYQGYPILSDYHQYVCQVAPRSSTSSNHSVTFSSSGQLGSPQSTGPPNFLGTNSTQEKTTHYTDSIPSKKPPSGMFCHSFKQSVRSDVDYCNVSFTSQELVYLWRNVLCCLGNINHLQHPSHHELALGCVVGIYDSLQNVKTFRFPEGPQVPCDYEMATWIIQAGDLAEVYCGGRVLAYEWMWGILSNRRGHETIIASYCNPMYRHLVKGWSRVDERLFLTLIKVGTNVFSRDLPGVYFLAPVAITTIVNLFLENKEGYSQANQLLHQNAITVLGSLLHLPHQFQDLLLPNINYHQLSQGEAVVPSIPVEDTKIQIQAVVLFLLNQDEWSTQIENFPFTFGMMICILSVQIAHELTLPSSQLFVQKNLTAILDQLYSDNHVLANVAIDCISSFAPSACSLYRLDSKCVSGIVEDIVGALNVHLNLHNGSSSPENRYVLTRLFGCLLEWLMVMPQHLLSDPSLESVVLGTLDRGIHSSAVEETSRSRGEPGPFAIKDAAQMVLMHLINHFGQENSNQSNLTTNFTEPELDEDNTHQYFGFNDTTIFTLYPGKDSTTVVVRNPLGKFGWDLGCESDKLVCNPNLANTRPNFTVPERDQNILERKEDEKVEFEDFPEANPDEPILFKVDMVGSTLDFIEKEFEASGSLEWIQTSKHQPNSNFSCLELPPETPGIPTNCIKSTTLPEPEPGPGPGPYQPGISRLFLDHLKVATFSNFQSGQFVNINDGKAFRRDLKTLDRNQSRETIKIGLVYVQEGQTSECSILCNQTTSQSYQTFLETIGWEVDLANHAGYMGGLERSGANGTTSIYYCNPTLEIMFHDITRMPNDPEDPQQVKKKRHIGNDPVHIVWNESRLDYSPYTIGGDFGNVQLVIHPLKNNMFDVRLFQHGQTYNCFGPLLNGMVLSNQILPNLVRSTAVNAYRSILCNSVGYHHNALNSSIQRAREIENIIRKHKSTATPFEDIIANLYNVNPPSTPSNSKLS